MEPRGSRKTVRTAAQPGERSLERAVGLRFLANETPRALGSLLSFQDRLSATDTWNSRLWSSYNTPPPPATWSGAVRAGSAHAAASPTSPESASPAPCTSRRASTSSVTATSSSSTTPSSRTRRRNSQSREMDRSEPMPSAIRVGRRAAEDKALQRAVARGEIKADSYTEGQMRATKASAAVDLLRSHGGAVREHAASIGRGKRSYTYTEAGGRAGQVASAVKTRRLDTHRRKHVVAAGISEGESGGGGDGEDERPYSVEVEVDLRKLLGV